MLPSIRNCPKIEFTRLSDQFIQDCFFFRINKPEGKKGSNKLRTYKLFKENFQLEYYLTAVATVRYRIRVSCHRLVIETGWYQKPTSLPINQRVCTLCNQVEDEIHLICICGRNAHLRMDFFLLCAKYIHSIFQFMLPKEKVIYNILCKIKDRGGTREGRVQTNIHAVPRKDKGPEETAQGGSRPSNSKISFPFCIFPARYNVTKEHTTPGPCPHHPFLTHAPQQQTPGHNSRDHG